MSVIVRHRETAALDKLTAGRGSYLVKMSSKIMPKEHCVMKVNNSLNDFFSLEPTPLIKWKKKKSYGQWMDQRWNKINRAEIYNKKENVDQVVAMVEGTMAEADLKPVLKPCEGKKITSAQIQEMYLWPTIGLYLFRFLGAGGLAKCRCHGCGCLFEEKLLVCRQSGPLGV